ncbi:MAG: hypothetical protein M3432_06340 [Chloroflexota bacterium]|nr:hypothetical protein [Chloroflexota bacterium]
MAVLRVAQEAMRSVRKHADAEHVWLLISYAPDAAGDGAGWIMESVTMDEASTWRRPLP